MTAAAVPRYGGGMTTLPSLKDTIAQYGLNARKQLGQHFLLDSNITDKIVRLCGDIGGLNIVEVGPGPGGLTRSILGANLRSDKTDLATSAGRTGAIINSLTVIEMDERAIPIQEQLQAHSAVPMHIIHGDALKVKLPQTIPAPRAVIANLPYNVGTDMLINWLHDIAVNPTSYRFLTLMFQKEVAERLYATPGGKEYGRLSVLAQWLCEVQPLFDLPPSAFSPPPKVTSSVVRLVPKPQRLPCEIATLERVTGAAFGQRRKMLRVSLKTLNRDVETLLATAGIDGTRRAETLSLEEFVRLANSL